MLKLRFLDVNGDYYLRKGMELERQRERLLESYARSRNPKTLDLVKKLTEECSALWNQVRLRDVYKVNY